MYVRFKMASWMPFIFVMAFIYKGTADLLTKNADNYGPYNVDWDNFGACRGPKSINMSTFSTDLIKQPDNTYRALVNVTFLDNLRVEEIRMTVYTIKDGKKTQLWHYNVNKPCQHYMLAAMLETYVKVKNCWVKKGDMFVDMPLTTLMRNHLGNAFFYGEYFFKVTVTTKKANVACFIFDPKFTKKV